jgi:DNA helicase-2/ATP-dependent DNA helicase PcrA
MTGVELSALGKRLASLQQKTARNPATPPEAACLTFVGNDSLTNAAAILKAFAEGPDHRVFRRPMLNVMLEALSRAAIRGAPLTEAAAHVREQHRAVAKPMPGRAVGSTLLLKGLEAEHAIILDADAMNASHLYVAISRASTSLTIFSSSVVVQPARR